eukprot:jgi/Botrbrau1/20976/Bobra.0690s0001.1
MLPEPRGMSNTKPYTSTGSPSGSCTTQHVLFRHPVQEQEPPGHKYPACPIQASGRGSRYLVGINHPTMSYTGIRYRTQKPCGHNHPAHPIGIQYGSGSPLVHKMGARLLRNMQYHKKHSTAAMQNQRRTVTPRHPCPRSALLLVPL